MQFASDLTTRFQLPVVIGLISILALALAAAITVSVLEITHPVNIALTSGFLVTFPTVACTFAYMYTADIYFIGLLLNALAVYLMKRVKYGFIYSIVLMAFACGIYQAYICYAVGLFLFDCILSLLDERAVVKQVVRRGLIYIGVIIASLLLYYGILQFLLAVRGVSLTGYQGINTMSLLNLKGFLGQIPAAYKNFYLYFNSSAYSTEAFKIIYILVHALFYAALAYLVFARKAHKSLAKVLLLAAGVALMPLALNLITILSAGTWVHELMLYAFVLQLVFTVKLAELTAQTLLPSGGIQWKFVFLANVLLCALLVWNNFCVSNTAYLRMQVSYENSYALANRIVARIESLEGYSPDLPVAVVGMASTNFYGGTVSEFKQYNSLTGTTNFLVFESDPHVRTRKFIEGYIGIRMKAPTQEQKNTINESGLAQAMPSYPAEGSVALHDGVVVVKLSDGTVR